MIGQGAFARLLAGREGSLPANRSVAHHRTCLLYRTSSQFAAHLLGLLTLHVVRGRQKLPRQSRPLASRLFATNDRYIK
jgi:hypothetical protein